MFIRMIFTIVCTIVLSVPLYAADSGTCDLARDIAQKAAQTWQKDKARGLKLYIQAQSLCAEDPVLNYNVGMAYVLYGNPGKGLPYLQKAVGLKKSNPTWLNNAASVQLQVSGDLRQALQWAEKAVKLQPDDARFKDTLAQVQYAAGRPIEALKTAAAIQRLVNADDKVKARYGILRDRYLQEQLLLIKDGKQQEGLEGLAKVTFDPEACRVCGLTLARIGKVDKALKVLGAARKDHQHDARLQKAWDDVMAMKVRIFYDQFQQGETVQSVAAARTFMTVYPNDKQAEKAFEDLFDALTSDAATIKIPAKRVVQRAVAQSNTDTEYLLSSIGPGAAPAASSVNLTVDVDQHIPAGSFKKGRHRVAVVIGNRHYSRRHRGLEDVRYADRDAVIMKKYLEKLWGYKSKDILFYQDATAGDLRTIFGDGNHAGKLRNYIKSGESDVFVYYVGHGAPGPRGEDAYLVPVDAEADYIDQNGYSLSLFYAVLKRLPVHGITVVLDACFSGDSMAGTLYKNVSPEMLKTIEPVQSLEHSVVFCGAGKDQVSTWYPAKRHSTFTYWFLKGIGGAADKNGDKRITVAEMSRYVRDEVSYTARRESGREQQPLVTGDDQTVLAILR